MRESLCSRNGEQRKQDGRDQQKASGSEGEGGVAGVSATQFSTDWAADSSFVRQTTPRRRNEAAGGRRQDTRPPMRMQAAIRTKSADSAVPLPCAWLGLDQALGTVHPPPQVAACAPGVA